MPHCRRSSDDFDGLDIEGELIDRIVLTSDQRALWPLVYIRPRYGVLTLKVTRVLA